MERTTKLTATQGRALQLLRSCDCVGEGGSATGPVTFTIHNGRTRREFPSWGCGISTYRALVAKGYATEEACEYAGTPAVRFRAVPFWSEPRA